ncbi:hypothetical protein Tco_1521500 [Tanacetum coccineum]
MIDELRIVETDKVNHTVDTDTMKLVVEIECFGVNFDEFDKDTGSSDELHEIHVVLNKHEADRLAVKISSRIHEVIPPSYKQTYRIHHKAYTPFLVSSMKFLA